MDMLTPHKRVHKQHCSDLATPTPAVLEDTEMILSKLVETHTHIFWRHIPYIYIYS